MKLDVMPVEESVLGFSSRWYHAVLRSAMSVQLPGGPTIRLVTPACFLASKLEAFEERGRWDYLTSHDLEDVLSVVDGRREIVAEIAAAEQGVRDYVAAMFERLLSDAGFLDALPGLIVDASPATRITVVLERLRAIIGTAKP